MTPINGIAPTVAMLLVCFTPAAHAGEWTTESRIASTTAIETGDGGEARLEVQCGHDLQVRLLHEALDAVPAETRDKRTGWHGTVMITQGWGLDLRRADHHGHRTRWWRCPDTPRCLQVHEADRTIARLKKSWTLYVRVKPKDRPALDMKFDLAGSAKAIEAACLGGAPLQR